MRRREFIALGYGVDFYALFRRAAMFVDMILKGRKPADIPIERAMKFDFVLNLKTAATIGIDVPTLFFCALTA